MSPEIAAALRTILIAGGGYAVGKNWLDNATLEAVVGAVIILGGAAWAWWSNRPQSKEAQVVAERVAEAPNVAPQIVKLEEGQVVTETSAIGRRSTDVAG